MRVSQLLNEWKPHLHGELLSNQLLKALASVPADQEVCIEADTQSNECSAPLQHSSVLTWLQHIAKRTMRLFHMSYHFRQLFLFLKKQPWNLPVCAAENSKWGQKRFLFAAAMLPQLPKHVAKAVSTHYLVRSEEDKKKEKVPKKEKEKKKNHESINTSTSSLLNLALSGSTDNSWWQLSKVSKFIQSDSPFSRVSPGRDNNQASHDDFHSMSGTDYGSGSNHRTVLTRDQFPAGGIVETIQHTARLKAGSGNSIAYPTVPNKTCTNRCYNCCSLKPVFLKVHTTVKRSPWGTTPHHYASLKLPFDSSTQIYFTWCSFHYKKRKGGGHDTTCPHSSSFDSIFP